MLLNLHILREDLLDLSFHGTLHHDPYELRLDHPVLCEGWPEDPSRDALYLVDASLLPDAPPRRGGLSLISFGEPPAAWLRSANDVLWMDGSVSSIEVYNRVVLLFSTYARWECSMLGLLDSEEPLGRAARGTQPLFPNPFAAISTTYRMVFKSFPKVVGESDEYRRYLRSIEGNVAFMTDEDIVRVASAGQFASVLEATEPVMFRSDSYGYETLVYPIRYAGETVALLCMDQVLAPITLRDRVLWKRFGDHLSRMFAKTGIYALSQPEEVRDVLSGLLAHRLLPEERIERLLSFYGWGMSDTFVTMAMAIRDDVSQPAALDALAFSIARATGNDCYAIVSDLVCFVFDLTAMGLSRKELIDLVAPLLGSRWLDASVSSTFSDFKDLYYFFDQAKVSGWIGWHKDPTRDMYLFEENAVEFMLGRLTEKSGPTIGEVYIPDELKALMEHDREYGTSYAHLVDVHLRNERNIAATIRQEFIHRNTFTYRMKRVREICGIDLDDEDMRLRLLVAFRLMELDGNQN